MKDQKEIGKVDDKQLAAWQRTNGKENVHVIKVFVQREETKTEGQGDKVKTTVIKDEVSHMCYLKEPYSEPTIIAEAIGKPRLERMKFLLGACWLGGSKEILEDTKLNFAAALQANSLISIYETEVVKS